MNKWLKRPYRFDRKPMDKDYLDGFVIQCTDDLVLLQVVTRDILLNGYSLIRGKDIKRYKPYTDFKSFIEKALAKTRQKPVPISINLASMQAAIVSANRKFPLVVINQEKKNNSICHIGSVYSVNDTSITLNLIDPAAEFEQRKRFRIADITKVDFGGSYEKALWLVASRKTKIKLKLKSRE